MSFFLDKPFFRWRMRSILKNLYMLILKHRSAKAIEHPHNIAYLFSGTYGDFVQILLPLKKLSEYFPEANIFLYQAEACGKNYVNDFKALLPVNVRRVFWGDTVKWFLNRQDLVITNSVGVYRIWFDSVAAFGARQAFGFKHQGESDRKWFFNPVVLNEKVKNFGTENLRLLLPLGISEIELDGAVEGEGAVAVAQQRARMVKEKIKNSPGELLFHIGAAGLKRDFGLEHYCQLVLAILKKLEMDWPNEKVKIVMGPGDEDIAQFILSQLKWTPERFSISQLVNFVGNFSGTILCFNSFFAHLCHYLEKSAVVIHRGSVPYGYDCSPLHKQVILSAQYAWDLSEVWEELNFT